MVAFLWNLDTPTDVWPSIHVYNSVAVEIMLLRSSDPRLRKKPVRIFTFLWCILIILATVFIKQHSLFDIATGLFMSAAVYAAVFHFGLVFRFDRSKKMKEDEKKEDGKKEDGKR